MTKPLPDFVTDVSELVLVFNTPAMQSRGNSVLPFVFEDVPPFSISFNSRPYQTTLFISDCVAHREIIS